jgi:hypothetical protein
MVVPNKITSAFHPLPEASTDRGGCLWPGAGAALVSRGVRSPGSTCRRGDMADRRGPRHASPASAIEASSAVAATKLGG